MEVAINKTYKLSCEWANNFTSLVVVFLIFFVHYL